MITYGYVHRDIRRNNLEGQLALMKRCGVEEERIFCDYESHNERGQSELEKLLGLSSKEPILKSGDLLLISSLKRLGNNWLEVSERWDRLMELGVYIQVLDMPAISTYPVTSSTEIVQDVVTQLVRYIGKPKRTGRPNVVYPPNWPDIRDKYLAGLCTSGQAAKELKISSVTFFKWVRMYKDKTPGVKSPGQPGPEVVYPSNWPDVRDKYLAGLCTSGQASKELEISPNTFFRWMRIYKNSTNKES